MYEIGVVEHFDATHSLKGDFGPATRKHSHAYRADLVVTGRKLRKDGTLFDLERLAAALRRVTGDLQHQNLDELPDLSGRNTTAEVVAEYVLERVGGDLDGTGLQSATVRVWESPGVYAAATRRLSSAPVNDVVRLGSRVGLGASFERTKEASSIGRSHDRTPKF